ncbi:tetratricopeptide (TPR) repeat protein [Actinokineospora baliensis]|uniref:ATP-binding protein n=1 Tax=Actinokineospora baliensis TaxID=547056 RepID=UPI001956C594|nr:tetratricopeptide repeat protein [Actinokineospora baliensis]MBM7772484.1 tetratricopeptide (TPR) repeat protein [Actinokineospora baliensis]
MPEGDGTRADNASTGDAENVVQVGTVRGGLHIHHRGVPAVPVPRQLPPAPAGFTNREPALRALDEHSSPAAGPAGAAVIVGGPGMGKTALALFWAHAARGRFPDGDLYIDMRGYGPESPLSDDQALDVFLRALGAAPEVVPRSVDEKAALYRTMVADRRLLIVIDNVVSARQIRRLLPATAGCLAVLTSRTSVSGLVAREGARLVTVDVLSPDDSVRLLAEIIGDRRVAADTRAAHSIANSCGHLPIALRIVAERAANRPHLRLAELATQLLGEHDRLDALALAEDELADVRAVFSWSYHSLSEPKQAIFRLIGTHPGIEYSTASIAALVDVEPDLLVAQLHELAAAHLLHEVAPGRFQLHDLIRVYARERCERTNSQRGRTEAVRRVLGWYLWAADAGRATILPHSNTVPMPPAPATPVPEFATPAAARAWFERERFTLLAAIELATDLGHYDLAWKLPVVLDGLFELSAYWNDWREIHETGLAAARALLDPLGMSANLLGLGDYHWRFGEFEAAAAVYTECAALARQIGHSWLIGFSTRGLGLAMEGVDDLDAAMGYYREALSVFDTAGLPRGSGMALLSIGKVHYRLGALPEAVDHCERAVAVFAGIDDQWSQAWGTLQLIQVQRDLGHLDDAIARGAIAVDIFSEFADHRSEAAVLVELGEVHTRRGDPASAAVAWHRAGDLYDLLGDPAAAAVRQRIGGAGGP